MKTRLAANWMIPALLSAGALGAAAVLLVQDGAPQLPGGGTHGALGAFSLASIAVAYLFFLVARWNSWAELGKGVLLATAFLFWAANQYWSSSPEAGVYNDIAIGLFVLDVVMGMAGRPAANEVMTATESGAERERGEGVCGCGRARESDCCG